MGSDRPVGRTPPGVGNDTLNIYTLPGAAVRFDVVFGGNSEQDVDVDDTRTGLGVKFWNNYSGGGENWTDENDT